MKSKLGSFLMMLGLLLLAGALAVFLYNEREAANAEMASRSLMPQLMAEIEIRMEEKAEDPDDTVTVIPGTPLELIDPSYFEMTEVEIGGYSYIGYISIPALGLDLPVMGDWDYERLRVAPCRYAGTVLEENLVIMAHNYKRHFGRLSELSEGDLVTFTDMDGKVHRYEVVGQDVLDPSAIEEMTAGDFDLTLFTCTYGGKSRVTVCCDRLKSE